MAKVFNQKIKILFLMKMLSEQTDESHVLSMQQILTQLEESGMRAERKSIYDDFEVLRNFGLDVRFKKSQPSGYYLPAHSFDISDVQCVLDLAALGGEKEKEQAEVLIEKIKTQLSSYQAEQCDILKSAAIQVSESNEVPSAVPEEEEAAPEKMRIQLLFKGKHIDAVKGHEDCLEEIKEHKSGLYKVWMTTVVDPSFYGWLVSLGFGIKIVKPKAEAELYRAYLKKLVKQYK